MRCKTWFVVATSNDFEANGSRAPSAKTTSRRPFARPSSTIRREMSTPTTEIPLFWSGTANRPVPTPTSKTFFPWSSSTRTARRRAIVRGAKRRGRAQKGRLPSVRPRVSRAHVNAAARFRNRSAMIRRRVAWWITGSKEGSATRPPGLGSRGQIQSAAKQDEPAGQRGDQREPLARQEDVSAEQEAADEGRSHQEDASEDPEPPFGGIVAVQTQEAHGDHANALRREHPSELGDGNLRDRDRRESGEDDPHADAARGEPFPSLGGTPWDHEAHGAPQSARRDPPDR